MKCLTIIGILHLDVLVFSASRGVLLDYLKKGGSRNYLECR